MNALYSGSGTTRAPRELCLRGNKIVESPGEPTALEMNTPTRGGGPATIDQKKLPLLEQVDGQNFGYSPTSEMRISDIAKSVSEHVYR